MQYQQIAAIRELAAALARDADALLSLGGQLGLQSLALSSMRLALAPDPSSLSFSNNLLGGGFLAADSRIDHPR